MHKKPDVAGSLLAVLFFLPELRRAVFKRNVAGEACDRLIVPQCADLYLCFLVAVVTYQCNQIIVQEVGHGSS